MTPVIEIERFLLRRWAPTDARDLLAFASDPEVMRYVDGLAWSGISQTHRTDFPC